jgi:hypothetical protein
VTSREYQRVIAYVSPHYESKDPLHGLAHALRTLDAARAIARSERLTDLDEILTYGALFHGLAARSLDRIRAYFGSDHTDLAETVAAAAVSSLGNTECANPADQILHDAHLIEGGALLYYLKPLLTGTYMHQSIEATISFIDRMLAEQPQCYFQYARGRMSSYQDEARIIHTRLQAEVMPTASTTR